MTEEQASQIIQLLGELKAAVGTNTEAITTLADGLNGNLDTLNTTVDDIEQGVVALVNRDGDGDESP